MKVRNISKKDFMVGPDKFVRKGVSTEVTQDQYDVLKRLYGDLIISEQDQIDAEKAIKDLQDKADQEMIEIMEKLDSAEKRIVELEKEISELKKNNEESDKNNSKRKNNNK